MIRNAPIFFSVILKHNSLFCISTGSLLLIGFFYGFLSTFSITISQLLCVRTLLLENDGVENDSPGLLFQNRVVLTSLSGLIISQFILFLSIYWQPLSFIWAKPLTNFSTFFGLFYIFFLWHRIKEFDFNFKFNSNSNGKLIIVFFDNLLLPILNFCALPYPVVNRLITVFLFRYSNFALFPFGIFFGWLSGQFILMMLSWILIIRLEKDLPILYKVTKRLFHSLFSNILLFVCLICLGKLPTIFLTSSFSNNLATFEAKRDSKTDIGKSQNSSTRTSFLKNSITEIARSFVLSNVQLANHRPYRIIPNTNIDEKRMTDNQNILFTKTKYSEYLFEICSIQGKQRLLHTYPASLFLFHTHFNKSIPLLNPFPEDSDFYDKWGILKQNRQKMFHKMLQKQMSSLDKSDSIDNLIQNKMCSWTPDSNSVNLKLDPRLANSFRGIKLIRTIHGPWFISSKLSPSEFVSSELSEFESSELTLSINLFTNSKFQKWFSNTERNTAKILPLFNSIKTIFVYPKISYSFKVLFSLLDRKKTNFGGYTKLVLRTVFKVFKKGDKPYNRAFPQRPGLFAKRRNSMIFKVIQLKSQTPFLLRIARRNFLQKFFTIFTLTRKTKKQRLAKEEIVKPPSLVVNSFRSPLLVIQAFIRKFIKFPLLIIFKNCAHFFIFGQTDWTQDFLNWNREKYVFHSAQDRKPIEDQLSWIGERIFSLKWFGYLLTFILQMVSIWLYGIQIGILEPFQLQPWYLSKHEYSQVFLTVLGEEIDSIDTSLPNKIKHPALWKPFLKAITTIINQTFYKQFLPFQNLILKISDFVNVHLVARFNNNSRLNGSPTQNKRLAEKEQTILQNQQKLETNISLKDKNRLLLLQIKTKQQNIQNDITELSNHLENQLNHNFSTHKFMFAKIRTQKSIVNINNVSKMQTYLINLNRKWLRIQKQLCFFTTQFKFCAQKTLTTSYHLFCDFLKNWGQEFTKYWICLNRKRFDIIHSVFHQYDSLLEKFYQRKNPLVSQRNAPTQLKLMTQAYIFHKIWQMKNINNVNFASMKQIWVSKDSFTNQIETGLLFNGILNKTPNDLTTDTWNIWLESLPFYKPSYFVWSNLLPNVWSEEVSLKYTEFSRSQKLSFIQNKTSFKIITNILNHHKPLFEQSQKLFKRWKLQMLSNRYTILSNNQIDTKFKSDEVSNLIESNNVSYEDEDKDKDKDEDEDKYEDEDKDEDEDEDNQWGFRHTKVDGFAPFVRSSSIINNDMLVDFHLTTDWKFVNNQIYSDTSFYTYVQSSNDSYYLRFQLIHDHCFMYNLITPIFGFFDQKQDTFDFLHNRFSESISESNYQSAILSTPEDLLLSENIRELRTLDYLNLKAELHHYQNKVETTLRNENSLQKEISSPPMNVHKTLNYEPNNNNNQFSSKSVQKQKHIKRFLWAGCRLEDLACMNRFWFQVANQSRFIALRTSIYPFMYL